MSLGSFHEGDATTAPTRVDLVLNVEHGLQQPHSVNTVWLSAQSKSVGQMQWSWSGRHERRLGYAALTELCWQVHMAVSSKIQWWCPPVPPHLQLLLVERNHLSACCGASASASLAKQKWWCFPLWAAEKGPVVGPHQPLRFPCLGCLVVSEHCRRPNVGE